MASNKPTAPAIPPSQSAAASTASTDGVQYAGALSRLSAHITSLQQQYRVHKPQVDQITKELAVFGFKPADPIDLARLPLKPTTIDAAAKALADGGKNVKSLQKALGIFDYAEMTRTRKALLAAGVTTETENYHGTNMTFIELASGVVPEEAEDQDRQPVESSTEIEEQTEPPVKVQQPSARKL